MVRKAIFYILFLIASYGYTQTCPNLQIPFEGSTGVAVNTIIAWEDVATANSYIISLGSTPGGTDIINELNVGSNNTFTPPIGLPESTTIYVTITLFIFNQPSVVCTLGSFSTENVTTVPECTTLAGPFDGDIDVNVATNITWNYAPRATGYRITIGTAPGIGDIENNLDVGNVLSFNPIVNLPFSTEIFIQITPYNENGAIAPCPEERFTTASLGEPPVCSQLERPAPGAVGVPLTPLLEWTAIANATGYIVSIGSSPFENDVLDQAIFTTNSTFVLNFDSNATYFVTIIPFNEAGQAQGCELYSFSTILGCGPYIDPDTGEVVDLNPEISLPDEVGICENALPTQITSPDEVDGYRWYEVRPNGEELLISEDRTVNISSTGPYRYEAYNFVNEDGVVFECTSTKEFTVVSSETAIIENIDIEELAFLFYVTVVVSGLGDYEFSLDDIEGPYGDDNVFSGLSEGTYTVYVRDKNGCGITSQEFRLAFPPTGFPPYFSPNGDGINDTWHYVPPRVNAIPISVIFIFDRYGKLVAQIGRLTAGWDGNFNGKPLPSSDYWYEALTRQGEIYTGHFSLVRYPRP